MPLEAIKLIYALTLNNGTTLYHHGILGQKWGIRRYQNKDGTLTAEGRKRYGGKYDIRFEKGSTYKHVSTNKRLKLKNDRTYLYDDKTYDKEVYEGPFSKYLQERGNIGANNPVYKHEYELTEHLVAPSSDKVRSTLKGLYEKDPESVKEDLQRTIDEYTSIRAQGSGLPDYIENALTVDLTQKTLEGDNLKKAQVIADASFQNRQNKLADKMIESLKDQGYNAMVDSFNKDIYNESVMPFIAFNGKQSLKEIDKARILTPYEIQKNYMGVSDRLNKKGKAIVLSDDDENVLYHHGILGQKWGIRRYQNPDGTLTPEGKERYNKDYVEKYKEKETKTAMDAFATRAENYARIGAKSLYDDDYMKRSAELKKIVNMTPEEISVEEYIIGKQKTKNLIANTGVGLAAALPIGAMIVSGFPYIVGFAAVGSVFTGTIANQIFTDTGFKKDIAELKQLYRSTDTYNYNLNRWKEKEWNYK